MAELKIVVLVPWRATGGYRDDVWQYVKRQWYGWDVREGNNDGSFERGKSINEAASGTWDVAFICDADMYYPYREDVRKACELAYETNAYVVPHKQLAYLTERGTRSFLAGTHIFPSMIAGTTIGTWIAGCAISRELWDRVQGFDPRFEGYGNQDIAFYTACKTLADGDRALRLDGTTVHVWHPPYEGVRGNQDLLRLYLDAADDPDAMRSVIAAR